VRRSKKDRSVQEKWACFTSSLPLPAVRVGPAVLSSGQRHSYHGQQRRREVGRRDRGEVRRRERDSRKSWKILAEPLI